MNQTKPQFLFQAGTGVLRAKVAPNHVMYYGRIALPDIGQCFIDGNIEMGASTITLSIKQAEDRKVVATLEIPMGACKKPGDQVASKIKVGKKTWKVVATLRSSEAGDHSVKHHLALRLPEVKIQPGAANAF